MRNDSINAPVRLVNALTVAALVVAAIGVFLLPSADASAFLLASISLDAIDGALGQHLDARGALGVRYDWAIDTAIAAAVIYRVAPAPLPCVVLVAALMLSQVVGSCCRWAMTGRTLVVALGAGMALGGALG